MSKKDVIELIAGLSHSQGFYGRLLRDLRMAETNGVDTSEFFAQFKDCKDKVDVILKIEG